MSESVVVRISPYVMAKIRYFGREGKNEFSGFGISESIGEVLRVVDFMSVKQEVGRVTVELDDDAVAGYFDRMAQAGRQPVEYGRIWLHSHPGMGTTPSGVDWATFKEVFGDCQWAIMLIIGDAKIEGFLSYRLFDTQTIKVPVEGVLDWGMEFKESNHRGWEEEFKENIREKEIIEGRVWNTRVLKHKGGDNRIGRKGIQQVDMNKWQKYREYINRIERGGKGISYIEYNSLIALGYSVGEIKEFGLQLFGMDEDAGTPYLASLVNQVEEV